ncbi:unnamed protein product [Protopolystoma xenopodis]|uniref:Uncharacterized protein n=1 Tax=Protopolystoma xenopodis TaxID=117903 RepID=A0A448WUJ8_9PLAT|nr:unnamed protein product [Protopolystoma xenopodis]
MEPEVSDVDLTPASKGSRTLAAFVAQEWHGHSGDSSNESESDSSQANEDRKTSSCNDQSSDETSQDSQTRQYHIMELETNGDGRTQIRRRSTATTTSVTTATATATATTASGSPNGLVTNMATPEHQRTGAGLGSKDSGRPESLVLSEGRIGTARRLEAAFWRQVLAAFSHRVLTTMIIQCKSSKSELSTQ